MVEVKIRWFKLFCNRRNLVIELSNTFTVAPKPIAVFAANSPTVPAPNNHNFGRRNSGNVTKK